MEEKDSELVILNHIAASKKEETEVVVEKKIDSNNNNNNNDDNDNDDNDLEKNINYSKALSINLNEGTTWHKVAPVSLYWKDLTVEVDDTQQKNKKKQLLINCTGVVPAGKMMVILGSSGAGKTTLLKALSGQIKNIEGTIWYEGKEKHNKLSDDDIMGFNGNACIVGQEDILMGSLTVYESIYYAAKLKIRDKNINVKDRVDHIIEYLGLSKCAHTKIGTIFFKGISGGEKRRTSVGIELVTQPALLFFDEITSGLDATSAYAMIKISHQLTLLGHSIIMTLHQPSSKIIDMLTYWDDYLMILEDGKQMYTGPIRNTIPFFSEIGFKVPRLTNPADFFLDTVNISFQGSYDNVNKIHAHFKEKCLIQINEEINNLNKNYNDKNRIEKKPNNLFKQIYYLLLRNTKNNIRNPAIFLIRIIMYGGLCLCLGSLYWKIGDKFNDIQDRISILFFVAAFLTFMSISGMPAFVEERHIYIRERMNNHYCTLSYTISNFLSSLPWIFFIALISTILIYCMIQSRLGVHVFFIYLANLFIALIVAESLMVAISAISPVFMIGLAAGAGILGLYMIVCGFFLLPSHIPAGWIWVHYAFSFHTYSFQIFMANEFNGLDTTSKYGTNGIDGEAVLKLYDMENVNIGLNFLWLCIMILFYRILFYIFLRFFNKTTK